MTSSQICNLKLHTASLWSTQCSWKGPVSFFSASMFDSLLVINQMLHSLLCSQASELTQFPSTSLSTTQQTLTRDLAQPFPQVQAQSADRSTPPYLTSTLEHIVGQLDVLTQVRSMGVFFLITDVFLNFQELMPCVCGTSDHFLQFL